MVAFESALLLKSLGVSLARVLWCRKLLQDDDLESRFVSRGEGNVNSGLSGFENAVSVLATEGALSGSGSAKFGMLKLLLDRKLLSGGR